MPRRSRDGVQCQGSKCKALLAIPSTRYCTTQEFILTFLDILYIITRITTIMYFSLKRATSAKSTAATHQSWNYIILYYLYHYVLYYLSHDMLYIIYIHIASLMYVVTSGNLFTEQSTANHLFTIRNRQACEVATAYVCLGAREGGSAPKYG